MAAYRRVYDSRHLQAECQEPGSAPEPYTQQSSMGCLYLFYAIPRPTNQWNVMQGVVNFVRLISRVCGHAKNQTGVPMCHVTLHKSGFYAFRSGEDCVIVSSNYCHFRLTGLSINGTETGNMATTLSVEKFNFCAVKK